MQMGFYFDQTRCTGCLTCVVACKDYNNIDAGPSSWRRVTTIEKGKYPDLFVTFLSAACHHCMTPACAEACPANAIIKRESDGIVIVDPEACLGKDQCAQCLEACPYQAPQFGVEENARMQKCNFCVDLLAENKKPACVDACPMRALDAGPVEGLVAKYGNLKEAEGFTHSEELNPSSLFKPKRDIKSLDNVRPSVAPGAMALTRN